MYKFNKLNTALSDSNTADSSSYVYKSYSGQSSTSVQTLTYTIEVAGVHFIDIKYRKDGSVNTGNDSLQVKSTIFEQKAKEISTGIVAGGQFNVATPEREGYTFVGWFTEEVGGTKVELGSIVNSDMTLYAHWEEN